jgi:sugar phosphate isomerase/epimerase
MDDLSRFAMHTITTKPWALETAVDKYAAIGVSGVSVWKEALEGRDPVRAGALIRSRGLKIISLVRGGFFPAASAEELRAKVDATLGLIRTAAELGAPMIVLVCGAARGVPIRAAREQVEAGIAAVLPAAEREGVRLAIEPLHPMYAGDRSVINTLKEANGLCARFGSAFLGVAVDLYHVWWDPELEPQIARCGAMGKLWAFHVCDWKTPLEDVLEDRGLMGEGCIDIRGIRAMVERSGFAGPAEVEIFSRRFWAMDQDLYLDMIKKAFIERV